MEHSFKKLFVVLAIMMSFVLVQGVYAQIFKGYVTDDTSAADKRTIGLDTDDDGDFNSETDVTIYGMGPSWYWNLLDISYPAVGNIVAIDAFYCDILDGYVGVSVCYLTLPEDDCSDYLEPIKIELRDSETLKPLWNPNAKSTDLSETAAEATGDCLPNDYNYEGPGPHKPAQ